MKNKVLYFIVILLLGASSCQCPSDIETPKEIIPTDYSNVKLLNAIPEFQLVHCYNNNLKLLTDLDYNSNIIPYVKLISGSSSLQLKNIKDSMPIFSTMLNLNKDSNYTLVLYGKSNRQYSLLLKDKIIKPNNEKSYIRFIHSSMEAPNKILFRFNNIFEYTVTSKSYTDFFEFESRNYDFDINNFDNDSNLFHINNLNIEKNKKYTIIIKGLQSFTDKRKLTYQILKDDI